MIFETPSRIEAPASLAFFGASTKMVSKVFKRVFFAEETASPTSLALSLNQVPTRRQKPGFSSEASSSGLSSSSASGFVPEVLTPPETPIEFIVVSFCAEMATPDPAASLAVISPANIPMLDSPALRLSLSSI